MRKGDFFKKIVNSHNNSLGRLVRIEFKKSYYIWVLVGAFQRVYLCGVWEIKSDLNGQGMR